MLPITYNQSNIIDSMCNPSALNFADSGLAAYFYRYLAQKIMSVFKWELPEHWSKKAFLYGLLEGCVGIINTNKYGVIPVKGYVYDLNVFWQPSRFTFANPLIRQPETPLVIDKDCVVFTPEMDWGGMGDIIATYAQNMALIMQAAAVNVNNSKLAYFIAVSNKAEAETAKHMVDDVQNGKMAVVFDKAMRKDGGNPFDILTQNVGANFIAPELWELLHEVEDHFYSTIGINNCAVRKKERLTAGEADSNTEEVFTMADLWLEQLQDTCKKCNDMFGAHLDKKIWVDWRIKKDGGSGTVTNGTMEVQQRNTPRV